MAFWFTTLTIAGVVLLCNVVWAIVVRRSGYVFVTAGWFRFLLNVRFPLYVLSGFVAGIQGTWRDGLLSAFVVAAVDGWLGWWLSARILRPRLEPLPPAQIHPAALPLGIMLPFVLGPLLGGIGALLSLLWR